MKWIITGWICEHLTHNRDITGDYGIRVVIHIPAGLIIALMVLVHWSLVIAFAWLFLKYERNEDAHTQDQAWKDIAGAMVGMVIGAAVVAVIKFS